jgi:acyl-CoA synthetase (AMP-forming)/AMP-acid ligase II
MFNQYGLTEASPRVTAISDEEEPFARGSVGRPIAGVSVCAMQGDKVCAPGEPGELVVRGPSVMLGFLDDADGTARVLRPEGLHSGDLGTVDAEGYVYVHGRNDDLVNVAGERISTHAIADTLRTLESVTDAFVVALPDAVLGYRLVAVVEAPEAALAQIRKAVRAELTPAQRPARVICVQHLPRSPNGKLDRARMRAWAEMGQADEGTAMCDRER